MTWSYFYLLCFLVGFSLSVLSFLAGAIHIHLPFKMHVPFEAAHHGGAGASHGDLKAGTHIPWFNTSSAMAFLAWFGGIGYLLTRHSQLLAVASLAIATLGGLAAGWVVFRFMVKLMNSTDSPMNSEDYRMEGSVGTVSMPIRESGGTGEIIFSLAGVRRCAGARCEDGRAIEKGAEVVIERYEKGIAYVKRWEEFTK
jgi:membrane protein implicated in regulation of membrane protease activity